MKRVHEYHCQCKSRQTTQRNYILCKFGSQNTAVAYKLSLCAFLCTFLNTECLIDNFIVVLKYKNYLEKRLLCILIHILSTSLELPRRGRLAHDHGGRQSAVVLLSFAFFSLGLRERKNPTPNQNLAIFHPFH